jgi:hypothetical protein
MRGIMRIFGRGSRVADRWADDPADVGTTQLLDELARGPMSPDRETLDRMGTRLRAEFAQRSAERAATGAGVERRALPLRLRPAAVLASVAILAVAGTAAAATESGPGEPFYHARLTVESLFLPSAGTDARLAADLDRADARLSEAQVAFAAGDWNAASDALGAYGEVVRSMAILAGTDSGARAIARLGEQLAVLTRLEAGAQDGAALQLGRAIDDVDALLGGGSSRPGGTAVPSPTGAGPAQTPGGQGGNESSGPNSGSTGGTGGSGSTAGPGASFTPGPQGTGQGGMPSGGPGPQGSGGR